MFDFKVWHILGRKYITADGLSRKLPTIVNIVEAEAKKDIDDFILTELNSFKISPISLDELGPILVNNYSDNSQKIATYLIILRQSPEIDTKEFNAFKKRLLNAKFKTTTFSIEIVRIYQYVKLLIIPWSADYSSIVT